MFKKAFLYITVAMLLCMSGVFADASLNESGKNLQGYTLFIPAGVSTTAILAQDINSKTAVVGQNINAILIDDFRYNKDLIASAGSIISGNVVYNKRIHNVSQMRIKFTTIITLILINYYQLN